MTTAIVILLPVLLLLLAGLFDQKIHKQRDAYLSEGACQIVTMEDLMIFLSRKQLYTLGTPLVVREEDGPGWLIRGNGQDLRIRLGKNGLMNVSDVRVVVHGR